MDERDKNVMPPATLRWAEAQKLQSVITKTSLRNRLHKSIHTHKGFDLLGLIHN